MHGQFVLVSRDSQAAARSFFELAADAGRLFTCHRVDESPHVPGTHLFEFASPRGIAADDNVQTLRAGLQGECLANRGINDVVDRFPRKPVWRWRVCRRVER